MNKDPWAQTVEGRLDALYPQGDYLLTTDFGEVYHSNYPLTVFTNVSHPDGDEVSVGMRIQVAAPLVDLEAIIRGPGMKVRHIHPF